MIKLKTTFIIALFVLFSTYVTALSSISGKVVTMDGLNPLAGVRVGLIRPADFPEGKFEYSTVTDQDGNYRIEGIKEESYIVSAVGWGYNPDYSYSISLHKDYENIEFRLTEYSLPAEIESVDLMIFRRGKAVNKVAMSRKEEIWQAPVELARGSYSYGFSVNGEYYRYYDLANREFRLNDGHIESTLEVKSAGPLTITFTPQLYKRVDYRSMIYDPFNWFICKSYREDLLKKGEDAGEFVTKKLLEKRLVFLSENHTTINSITFLATILSDLYHKAGLRYLFLEGYRASYSDMLKGDFSNPGASLPWENNALRYQWIELMRAVDKLNSSLPPEARLKVINAEEGFRDADVPTIDDEVRNIQNRDSFAYKRINAIMKSSKPDEKGLIFYGGAHGSKKEYKYHNSNIFVKSLSSYLNDEYGESFYSISIDNYSFLQGRDGRFRYPKPSVTEYLYWKMQLLKGDLAVECRDSYRNPGAFRVNRSLYNGEALSNYYDGLIYLGEERFGLPYGYIKNRYTIEKLIFLVKNRHEGFAKYSYNQTLYCLKLLLGDRFSYSLWNSPLTIDEAIAELEKINLAKIRPDSPKAIRRKAEFCDYLVKGKRAFEARLGYTDALYYLEKAHKLYKTDLYPLYYLMLTNYEMGRLQEARRVGEKLAAAPGSYNMVELPEIYSLLAHIHEELGSSEKALSYKERLNELYKQQ